MAKNAFKSIRSISLVLFFSSWPMFAQSVARQGSCEGFPKYHKVTVLPNGRFNPKDTYSAIALEAYGKSWLWPLIEAVMGKPSAMLKQGEVVVVPCAPVETYVTSFSQAREDDRVVAKK